jgi:ribonuclease P protein component
MSGAFYFCKKANIKTYTLGPKEKLKSRKLIEEVFQDGEKLSLFPFRVFFLFGKTPQPLQAGFAVSSSHFKKAVDRNRIKRLCRESYRLQKNSLVESLIKNNKSMAIFFIYTGRELPAYS